MKLHACLGPTTGFVRAGNYVWLLSRHHAHRIDGDELLSVDWDGESERPFRLAAPGGLWRVRMVREPEISPADTLAASGAPNRIVQVETFHARGDLAIWVERSAIGHRGKVHRTDGLPTKVRAGLLNENRLRDLAALPRETLILVKDGLVRVTADGSRQIDLPPLSPDAHFLRVSEEEILIRDGPRSLRIRGEGVEELPLALEVAGEALAVREGNVLRLLDHPLASHNALRGARHIWVEGRDRMWITDDESITVLREGHTRTWSRRAPKYPHIESLLPTPRGFAVVSAREPRGGPAAIDEFDGQWRRVAELPNRPSDSAPGGDHVWLTAPDGLLRVQIADGAVEAMNLGTSIFQVTEAAGVVVAVGSTGVKQRETSAGNTAPVWRDVPLPVALSGKVVSEMAVLDGRLTLLLFGRDDTVLAVRDPDSWKSLSLTDLLGARFGLGSAVWILTETCVSRWNGGASRERWHLPFSSGRHLTTETGSPRVFWYGSGNRVLRCDLDTGEVRQLDLHGKWTHLALKTTDGRLWLSGDTGVTEVDPAELKLVARLERLPDVPAELDILK